MTVQNKLENQIQKLLINGRRLPAITPTLIQFLDYSLDTQLGVAMVFISVAMGLSRLLRRPLNSPRKS